MQINFVSREYIVDYLLDKMLSNGELTNSDKQLLLDLTTKEVTLNE
jgi:hypothetical protein